MESTSKEDDEGRNGGGRGGTEEGRRGREGEEEDGREGLCSCKNSLKYGLRYDHLHSVSDDDVVGLQFNQQSKAFMSR